MFAYNATRFGKKCLVIDKADNVGGLCYSKEENGIEVHQYGAHIFRTDSKRVWDFVNSICEFVPFVNAPIAKNGDEVYNLPFNMNTFHALFGVSTPDEAIEKIRSECEHIEYPKNLEEFVLTKVGRTIYEKLIKGYTEKQWGVPCSMLPVSTMSRIPMRFVYDNNYYNETYQGIPVIGYTAFIKRLLAGSDIITGYNFARQNIENACIKGIKVLYTGSVDELCDYCYGRLNYRSVRFDTRYMPDCDNFQGNAVVNYTGHDVIYTRSIEHKHFMSRKEVKGTIVTYEYPCKTGDGEQPAYPMLDTESKALYNKYVEKIKAEMPNVILGGRLGLYRYYSMNEIIESFV